MDNVNARLRARDACLKIQLLKVALIAERFLNGSGLQLLGMAHVFPIGVVFLSVVISCIS